MTLLQELQASIRANSSSGGLPFALAAAAMPSNAPRPEVSSLPPHGRSSRASILLSENRGALSCFIPVGLAHSVGLEITAMSHHPCDVPVAQLQTLLP